MGPVALDTNVVLGFLDPDDAHHARATEAMREFRDAPKVLPAIAYAESLVHAVAEGRDEGVERFIRLGGVDVVPLDRSTARYAAELRARFGTINIADAAVLATAVQRGAFLLTFDAQLALARDRVP